MSKQLNKQRGFSLILVVLILTAMLSASLIISNLVLRVSRSTGKVSASEIAYYAGETAAEKSLYKINKEHKNISDFNSWKSEINSSLGSGAAYELININKEYLTNPIDLDPGESYQLDLDLNGVVYPNLTISGTGGGEIVLLKLSRDAIPEPLSQETFATLPQFLNLSSENYYKLRIINSTLNPVSYTITPDAENLVVGATITTKGVYQETERILETRDLKWQIYGGL